MRGTHGQEALRRSVQPARGADLTSDDALEIRAVAASDRALEQILALNRLYAVETSVLEADRLRAMLAASFAALAIGDVKGVLIAFDPTSSYDSPNFLWFKRRYRRFVYVDRVIVAPAMQARGLARALYARVATLAREAGHTRLACEVNVDPPNPASTRFHASLGFVEVDRARVEGDKTVARMLRPLDDFSPRSRAPPS